MASSDSDKVRERRERNKRLRKQVKDCYRNQLEKVREEKTSYSLVNEMKGIEKGEKQRDLY